MESREQRAESRGRAAENRQQTTENGTGPAFGAGPWGEEPQPQREHVGMAMRALSGFVWRAGPDGGRRGGDRVNVRR